MFNVFYVVNDKHIKHGFNYISRWAAILQARDIFDFTDHSSYVIDNATGEVVASFDDNGAYVAKEDA